jgi:gliding motility-associated-like protein
VTPRTNVRQEVLPPNSTLAKQLAADPVLRTLSDENVEWTPPTHLSIPNLFTPNGDGVNDMFVIEGLEGYSSPRLVVRDKNNRIVYQSANYRNNWDGGSCPEGVYSYEFTFTYQGIENQAVGKVRIMRG